MKSKSSPAPRPRVSCFGEALWDCLPEGDKPGGAPLNVAYHLARLGLQPSMISAVGKDNEGTRLLKWMRGAGIGTDGVAVVDDLPTGRVSVSLDADRNATYEILEPAAWDAIPTDNGALQCVIHSQALVFGTLACRSAENRERLKFLAALVEPLKIFDVNLRSPHDNIDVALELGRRSDVVKLNEEELFRLADLPDEQDGLSLHAAVSRLAELTGCGTVCVTRGEQGALCLRDGNWYSADSPPVKVKDTVGAGDAFTAALICFLVAGDPSRDFSRGLAACCELGGFVASCEGAQPEYDPDEVLKDVPWRTQES